MKYRGKIDDSVFVELYNKMVLFEKLLSRIGEYLSFKNVCKYSGSKVIIFHSSRVFEGKIIFTGGGVLVSIMLNSDDPVDAFVEFSRDPNYWFDMLEKDFEKIITKYVVEYEKMKKVLTRESSERRISSL